jgi:hypothetical protein
MKSVIKIQRLVEKELTSVECRQLEKFCGSQAFLKADQEHRTLIENIGIGNDVLVRGGSSLAVENGLACLIGKILKYNPKTVTVKFSETRSWRVPYDWLTTIDRLEKEKELKQHVVSFRPYLAGINKITNEVLAK